MQAAYRKDLPALRSPQLKAVRAGQSVHRETRIGGVGFRVEQGRGGEEARSGSIRLTLPGASVPVISSLVQCAAADGDFVERYPQVGWLGALCEVTEARSLRLSNNSERIDSWPSSTQIFWPSPLSSFTSPQPGGTLSVQAHPPPPFRFFRNARCAARCSPITAAA